VITNDRADLASITKLRAALDDAGARLLVIAPHGGTLSKRDQQVVVERTFLTTRSIEFDAVVVAGGAGSITDPRMLVLLQEAYRHCKAIAAWGDGVDLLDAAGVDPAAPGVIVSTSSTVASRKALIRAIGLHRAWDRFPA
jgi:catalase